MLDLRYDPDLVSIAQVRRSARQAGAVIGDRYRHETCKLAGMDCGDCATSIEHVLGRLSGVIAVSVNYASERMRIEYDTAQISRAEIVRRVRWMGYRVDDSEARSWWAQNLELLLALSAARCGWPLWSWIGGCNGPGA